jgi:Thymidine phosphorylase
MYKRIFLSLALAMMVLIAEGGAAGRTELLAAREKGRQWFGKAKFGVFVHYLGQGEEWNKRIDSFDVGRFAEQIAKTKAGYVIFTLGQNSGHYCSPNATYEKYAGYKRNQRCSKRDLPMEISDALAKRGIRLMLYLPSRSPQRDKQAMAGLGDVHERQPAPQEFTSKWSEVIREWSLRYGRKVSGRIGFVPDSRPSIFPYRPSVAKCSIS